MRLMLVTILGRRSSRRCSLNSHMFERLHLAAEAPHVAKGGRKDFISSGDEACIRAGSLRAMISGSPNIAQASPNPSEAGEKPSSVIAPVDYSIAVDPIKYVGVPDSNIVDND